MLGGLEYLDIRDHIQMGDFSFSKNGVITHYENEKYRVDIVARYYYGMPCVNFDVYDLQRDKCVRYHDGKPICLATDMPVRASKFMELVKPIIEQYLSEYEQYRSLLMCP